MKNLPAVQETWVRSQVWEDPLEEGMATTPVFLPGKSPWTGAWWATVHGVAESDTSERLTTAYHSPVLKTGLEFEPRHSDRRTPIFPIVLS